MARVRRQNAAFTLVELLVVIGIIALLLAILLPVLSNVRESSKRTKCLSNLRGMGQAMMMYADQYRGQIPLGYWSGQKQSNFLIHYNRDGTAFYTMLGTLHLAGLMKAPEAFYCPSEVDERWLFQTSSNPWPADTTPSIPNRSTRCGYGVRPTVNWLETGSWPEQMSKLIKFKNRAIIADIVATPYFIQRRHQKGVNVCYADGSVKWVDRKVFDSYLKPIPDLTDALHPNWNDHMQNENVTPFTGVWPSFDK